MALLDMEAAGSGDEADHQEDYEEDEERQSDRDFIADEEEEERPTLPTTLGDLVDTDEEELAAEVKTLLITTMMEVMSKRWSMEVSTIASAKKLTVWGSLLMHKHMPNLMDFEAFVFNAMIGNKRSAHANYKDQWKAFERQAQSVRRDAGDLFPYGGVDIGKATSAGVTGGPASSGFLRPCHSQSDRGASPTSTVRLGSGVDTCGHGRGGSDPGDTTTGEGDCRCMVCELE